MSATAFGIAARAVGLALVLALAAALGVAAGNLIQARADGNAGYPEGWQGGAAAPITRTADAAFSLDAIAAVQAARGDAAAEADEFVDYGLRHAAEPAAETDDYVDYGLRHAAEPAATKTTESLAKPAVR